MVFEIRVPRLGWSMEEGTFSGWLKKEGELIRAEEELFSLESEKSTQGIEALDSGILHIHPQAPLAGQVVAVGALLGVLAPEGHIHSWDPSSPSTSIAEPTIAKAMAPASPSVRRLARQKGIAISSIQGSGKDGRILPQDLQPVAITPKAQTSTPRARRLATKLNIDWHTVTGSGKGNRVRERDIQNATQSQSTDQTDWIRLPISKVRKRIAERLILSRQTTVPVTMTTKAVATQIINLRQRFKNGGKIVPAYTDILGKLTALCLIQHPLLAGQWQGDHIAHPPRHGIHIGIAVDTEHGLMVPVIRDLVHTPLVVIAKTSQNLTEAARKGKLPGEDMQGGVFTLSSLGSLGIEYFTPVINPPQSAILGIGSIQSEVRLREDGSFLAVKSLPLSLTFDHRVIDGADAARFLRDLVLMIEKPEDALPTDPS